jgi:hypothetical protein
MVEQLVQDSDSGSSAPLKKGMVLVHGAGNFELGYQKPFVDYIQGKLGDKQFGLKLALYADACKEWLKPKARSTTQVQDPLFRAFQTGFRNEIAREMMIRQVSLVALASMSNTIQSSLSSLNLPALMGTLLVPGANMGAILNLLNPMLSKVVGVSMQDVLNQIDTAFKPPAAVTTSSTVNASSLGSGAPDISLVVEMVYHYLYDETIAQKIQQIVEQTLLEATQEYDEIVLVSHSLGNLVTFDVLNQWTHGATKVTDWFTLGCPLIKSRRLHPGDPGPNRLPVGRAERWFNLYDTRDIIADALGPAFGRPGSYIYDVYVSVGNDPMSAHDYLNNNPTRDMVAEALM